MSLPSRGRMIGLFLGFNGLPFFAYAVYDRLAFLPAPFDACSSPFPFVARFWIRKAMQLDSRPEWRLTDLAEARKAVLATAWISGPASPQATLLMVVDAEERLKHSPSLQTLDALWTLLCTKPHVGEGAAEERLRTEAAFKVAAASCDLLLGHERPADARERAAQALCLMDKAPAYLSSGWALHPLRRQFEAMAGAGK